MYVCVREKEMWVEWPSVAFLQHTHVLSLYLFPLSTSISLCRCLCSLVLQGPRARHSHTHTQKMTHRAPAYLYRVALCFVCVYVCACQRWRLEPTNLVSFIRFMMVQHGSMCVCICSSPLPPSASPRAVIHSAWPPIYPFNTAAATPCICSALPPKGLWGFVSQMWQDCQEAGEARGRSDINQSVAGSQTLSDSVY